MAISITAEIRSAINDRLRMIAEELRSFLANHQFGIYRKCLSNLYYACFHGAVLLLESKGLSAKSHSGANSLFAAHFVKAGRFDKKYVKILSKLESQRQAADYQSYVDFDEEDVGESLALALPFLREILAYLKAEIPDCDWQRLESGLSQIFDTDRIKLLLQPAQR